MKKRKRARDVRWHAMFGRLLWTADVEHRGASRVVLARDPQRIDFLPLRVTSPRPRRRARVLVGPWPHLRVIAIVEFKSKGRPYRAGNLMLLHGYARQYHAAHVNRVTRKELSVVLIVPSRTRR